jgi:pyruvate,water dikinase
MLHKDIPRFGPRAMDAKGFLHVVMRQAFADPEWDRTLRDPCYAIISDSYVNLATRVGFHFSAVDAYCSDAINLNYITFRFKGGAADEVRRVRRVRAIGRILKELGFSATVTGDLVAAQFLKRDRRDILRNLEMLGRLLQFMRQMDAAMASEQVMEQTIADFLAVHSVREP